MKKLKKIAYIFLIIVIALLSVALYANANKESEKNEKDKGLSEIEFLDTKLITLLNDMNNIETRNYNVAVSEISKQTKKQTSENTTQKEDSQSGTNSQSETNTSNTDSSNTSDSSEKVDENAKKFELKSSGILTNSSDVDWEKVKSEIELLYSSLPTITLDLYQLNVNQEDVLGFNKEFDNLTSVAKNEKKDETLKELSKLYEYIPKFTEKATEDEVEKNLTQTKSNIFKAYSKLDSKDWGEISKDTKQAIDTYSRLMANTNIESSKQYSISKAYVMINELQNAVDIKNESIFLIKYKNILEELNNI